MCSSCCVTSVDKDTISSTTPDLFKLKEVINRQRRYCLYCRKEVPDVDVQIFLNTVDALLALGFPDPQGGLTFIVARNHWRISIGCWEFYSRGQTDGELGPESNRSSILDSRKSADQCHAEHSRTKPVSRKTNAGQYGENILFLWIPSLISPRTLFHSSSVIATKSSLIHLGTRRRFVHHSEKSESDWQFHAGHEQGLPTSLCLGDSENPTAPHGPWSGAIFRGVIRHQG